MFVGHLAVALVAKRVEPKLSLGVTVAAAFGLDLLWPLFLLAGLEVVSVHPHDTAFTSLEFVSYPWSHSLLFAIGWAVLGGLIAKRLLGSARSGALVGALIVSHWVLDLLMHRPDLPLWPGGPVVGLGIWHSLWGTYVVEGALFAAGLFVYLRVTVAKDRIGSLALYALAALCTLIWATQPFAPPPPNANAVAWGAMLLWLFPFWAAWADRHRALRPPGEP